MLYRPGIFYSAQLYVISSLIQTSLIKEKAGGRKVT